MISTGTHCSVVASCTSATTSDRQGHRPDRAEWLTGDLAHGDRTHVLHPGHPATDEFRSQRTRVLMAVAGQPGRVSEHGDRLMNGFPSMTRTSSSPDARFGPERTGSLSPSGPPGYSASVSGAGKSVTLVLCTADGRPLGALPAFEVDTPWWPEVAEVVERARELHGVDVTILRLIGAPEHERSGGAVAYLAEVHQPPSVRLAPMPGDVLTEHPLRQSYARPGGPQRDLDWAVEALARRGQSMTGAALQIKTWNLSSIWRLPTSGGDVWLKVVPPFFAHEAVIMSYLDAACVPRLLGAEPGRVVMAHIDGEDHFSTSGSALLEMMELLIGLQLSCLDKVPELLSLGLPDRRLESIIPRFAGVVEDQSSALSVAEMHRLENLLRTLDGRAAAIEA